MTVPISKSAVEDKLEAQLKELGVPPFVREFRFCPTRMFRSDFAWEEYKLLVEVEGGTFGRKSRHTTGAGYAVDLGKYNLATMGAWHLLRFDSKMVGDGTARAMIRDWFLTYGGWSDDENDLWKTPL